MKLALATDAWLPQVNGVVRALTTTTAHLERRGFRVEGIVPADFRTVPCPSYPEIRLALRCRRAITRRLDAFAPDCVHIATEGPIGWATRAWCLSNRVPFTTSFHTRFPDYVALRTGVRTDYVWSLIGRFHAPAARTMVATRSLAEELITRRIKSVHLWPLGVDTGAFGPNRPPHPALINLPRPIMLNVGRVAVEKNLPAFLDADVPGSKVVVGSGPALAALRSRYPRAHFLGPKHGAELASIYASADVFVFPSRTDTFGLVNIEALASGLPIAAFPVAGPLDILGPDCTGTHGSRLPLGALHAHLGRAIALSLAGDRQACITEASHYDWERCTDRFVEGLAFRVDQTPALAA